MDTENSQNKFINFFKSNVKILFFILGILILFIASIIWFTNNNKTKKTIISDNFIKAQILIEDGQKNEAKKILLDLVQEKNTPYSSLSLFLIIENKLVDNKETIINYFDEIINNNSFKKEDLNLIKLKKAIYISEISKEQEIIKLLNPIINSNSVWKSHALKFLGDFYSSNGQNIKADQYYKLFSEIDKTYRIENTEKIE